jgi:hypothetical protein
VALSSGPSKEGAIVVRCGFDNRMKVLEEERCRLRNTASRTIL